MVRQILFRLIWRQAKMFRLLYLAGELKPANSGSGGTIISVAFRINSGYALAHGFIPISQSVWVSRAYTGFAAGSFYSGINDTGL